LGLSDTAKAFGRGRARREHGGIKAFGEFFKRRAQRAHERGIVARGEP